jgi:hypothetical protein
MQISNAHHTSRYAIKTDGVCWKIAFGNSHGVVISRITMRMSGKAFDLRIRTIPQNDRAMTFLLGEIPAMASYSKGHDSTWFMNMCMPDKQINLFKLASLAKVKNIDK